MDKIRESGMPDEGMWTTFFAPEEILERLGLTASALTGDVIDLGCGYGTFTLAAARRTSGTVYAIDIEPAMVATVAAKARAAGLHNIVALQRDVVAAGLGRPPASCAAVLIFNLLHTAAPVDLLKAALHVLAPGGRLALLHWRPDPTTPRGPPMAIRPRPAQVQAWMREAGFEDVSEVIDVPPYHYGVVGRKG